MLTILQKRGIISAKGSPLKGPARKWMDRHINDPYVKQAKIQAYRSRAAFKLIEIDQKFMLFKHGMKVIDVGAAPGGWSQIIAEKVNSQIGSETVVAVDLLQMENVDGVKFLQGDIEKEEVQEKLSEMLDFQKADLICSDAAPEFVGERFVDHMRATDLNYQIIQFCEKNLRKGGSLLMKIMQGPAEQKLYDDAKLQFEKLQRVKPSASRQESKEIYFLAQGYDESQEELAQQIRLEKKKIDNVRSPEEAERVMSDILGEGKEIIQELINEALKRGHDLPEGLRDRMKGSEVGRDLNIEQKMSLREKQKAKKRSDEEVDRMLYEQTGLKDMSKDYTMENIIKKYNYDMERHEKKLAKMSSLEKQGVSNYDINDIHVSDDEREADYIERLAIQRVKKDKGYEDEPYKAKEDEAMNLDEQYENIEKRLDELKGKAGDATKMTRESDYFKEYEQVMDEMEKYHDALNDDDSRQQDEQIRTDEMKEHERLFSQEKGIKDQFYGKRAAKEKLKKTGGAKSQSPVWNDDD